MGSDGILKSLTHNGFEVAIIYTCPDSAVRIVFASIEPVHYLRCVTQGTWLKTEKSTKVQSTRGWQDQWTHQDYT